MKIYTQDDVITILTILKNKLREGKKSVSDIDIDLNKATREAEQYILDLTHKIITEKDNHKDEFFKEYSIDPTWK